MFGRPSTDREVRRLDVAIALVGAALAATTILLLLVPDLSGRIVAPLVDVAINVAATLGRWRGLDPCLGPLAGDRRRWSPLRERRLRRAHSYEWRRPWAGPHRPRGPFGFNPGGPEAASAYLWTSARLMAGALLVSGAVRGLRRTTPPNRPLAIALGPTIGLLVVVVAVLGGSARHSGRPSDRRPARQPGDRRAPDRRLRALPRGCLVVPPAVRPGTPGFARVPRRRPHRGRLQPAAFRDESGRARPASSRRATSFD